MGKLWLAGVLTMLMGGAGAALAQSAIPDSPRPQTLPDTASVIPGQGATSSTTEGAINADGSNPVPAALPSGQAGAAAIPNETEPELKPELGPGGVVAVIRANVNFVQVPFTVKDNKGQLVPGLTWRDVEVFENGARKHMSFFTVDPYPLSVAFVIDQSLEFHTMGRVNAALGAVQGAFTPYDEMAVYTYNNGPQLRSDYSKADGARVTAVIEQSKSTGREDAPMVGGPLSRNIYQNDGANQNTLPNVGTNHGVSSNVNVENLPKEQHVLNDAMFMAAQSLAKRPDGRRRILYVVSDGREYGSKVKDKDLIRYLQTNNITVYATLVGDSANRYEGFLDRYHLPFETKDNNLPKFVQATGGETISAVRTKTIENSFAKIAEDVRVKYTAGYYSNEPVTDGKFRTWEVKVMRPGLNVIAPRGYFPTPRSQMRAGSTQPRTTAQ